MDNTIARPVVARGVTTEQNLHCTGAMAWALLALYIALGSFTSVFPARFGAAPFHPEAAVAMALLMLGGFRFVPLVLLAVLVGEIALPGNIPPLAPLLINSVILTIGYAAMAYLLVSRFRIRIELETRPAKCRLPCAIAGRASGHRMWIACSNRSSRPGPPAWAWDFP